MILYPYSNLQRVKKYILAYLFFKNLDYIIFVQRGNSIHLIQHKVLIIIINMISYCI